MNIIIDTREKNPWDFTMWGYSTVVRKLDCGDYSIDGLEDKIIIERKRSTGEISMNFGKKRRQFENELKLLKEIETKIVVCEFPYSNLFVFPEKSGIPKRDWSSLRMNKGFLMKQIEIYKEQYGVDFRFYDSRTSALNDVIQILNDVAEKYGKKEMAF